MKLYNIEYSTDCLLKAFYKSCFKFFDTGLESAVQVAQAITNGTPEQILQLITSEIAELTGLSLETVQTLINQLAATLTTTTTTTTSTTTTTTTTSTTTTSTTSTTTTTTTSTTTTTTTSTTTTTTTTA